MIIFSYVTSLQLLRKCILQTNVCRFSSKYIEEGSIYIHWPYCRKRCSYCNFVKFIPTPGKFWTFPNEIIEAGLVKELEDTLNKSCIKRVNSVFFGGGTPSLANHSLVSNILEAVNRVCILSEKAEVTLEANPTRLETKKLKKFKESGVNRISIGVQSLNADFLRLLNRDHSNQEAVKCIDAAKNIFSGKASIDMMFALPFQTLDMWKNDLESVLKICDDHLSLYQLTLEKGTKLYNDVTSGNLPGIGDEITADMYELAVALLGDYGFYRYEISNFAKNSDAESIHNKNVWQGSQFVGVGPGSHSRVIVKNDDGSYIREARRNVADPASWLSEVNAKGNGIRIRDTQSTLDIQLEYLATSLRTRDGLKQERWMEICDTPIIELIDHNSLDSNLMQFDSKGNLRATSLGMNVLDSILPTLINLLKKKKRLMNKENM